MTTNLEQRKNELIPRTYCPPIEISPLKSIIKKQIYQKEPLKTVNTEEDKEDVKS